MTSILDSIIAPVNNIPYAVYKCSECKRELDGKNFKDWQFCPFCGSRLKHD